MISTCKTNTSGNKYWTLDDKIYYPAVQNTFEYRMNGKVWYCHGLMHRDGDMHAIEFADGSKHWYQNGKMHRDGILPAVERGIGGEVWYKHGIEYTLYELAVYYSRLARFGKYCLAKIKLRRLKHNIWIHGELLCRPAQGCFPGGRDYLAMTDYFNELAN